MHQVDNDTTRAPFLLSGTALEWVPREPVMFGTRLHFVPQSVDGRPFEMRQRTKSGGKGRPKTLTTEPGPPRDAVKYAADRKRMAAEIETLMAENDQLFAALSKT